MGELLTEHHGGGVVKGDGSGGQSPSRQGVGTGPFDPPELGFLVAAELRCVSGENLTCSGVFSVSGEYIGEEAT